MFQNQKEDYASIFVQRISGRLKKNRRIGCKLQLRVLHFYKNYYPESHGGVARVIDELTNGQKKIGIHSEVLVHSYRAKKITVIPYNGTKVHQVPALFELAATPFSTKIIGYFRKLQKQFDIINIHYPYPFADLVFMLSFCKKPLIVTYHSDIVKQKMFEILYSPIRCLLFKKAKFIVPTSDNYVETSLLLKKYTAKIKVVPLGLSDSLSSSIDTNKGKYEEQFGKNYLSFIGVFRYYKGLPYLVRAAAKVGVNIVLMGEGPEFFKVRQLVESLGARNIHLAGRVSNEEKNNIISNSLAFVFPSIKRSEAFGLGLVEAAMLEKALITCEIGTGTSYITKNNHNGIVIEPFDEDALGKAMLHLVNNPEIAYEMGKNSRLRYLSLFHIKEMSKKYHELYEAICSKQKTF